MAKVEDLTRAELDAFAKWLAENGEKNEARAKELFRFKLREGVVVISKCTDGHYNLTPPGIKALDRFRAEKGKAVRTGKHPQAGKRYIELAARDESKCFYCAAPLSHETATIEHLVARADGGPDDLKNLVLARGPCNKLAGNRSVVEKVRLREIQHVRENFARKL